ncbi:hypothetical protein [Mesorhizobium sp. M7A.F.Ca.US.011.01.1.1]|uniref:hypothetical protein n=1 Tax=Mesorhizobium sp. M7A.F.Ca.US.011.01.1.1 TaxID=2496741 RepID=UPI0013E38A88|nr:hypothetical protein [Mesorhizobium sp. M7A.F.Ca.US.011.01.1.1]
MMTNKRVRQVALKGTLPPKKEVSVSLNETEAERKRRRSMERYRHERELAGWKRSK